MAAQGDKQGQGRENQDGAEGVRPVLAVHARKQPFGNGRHDRIGNQRRQGKRAEGPPGQLSGDGLDEQDGEAADEAHEGDSVEKAYSQEQNDVPGPEIGAKGQAHADQGGSDQGQGISRRHQDT